MGKSKTNVGAIAGGAVGGVLGLLAIAGAVLFFMRRNAKKQQEEKVRYRRWSEGQTSTPYQYYADRADTDMEEVK